MTTVGLLALRCPYCGGEIKSETVYTGRVQRSRSDCYLVGYECGDHACAARWDKRGQPERGPKLLRAAASAVR